MTVDEQLAQDAPPRRGGRNCGYTGQPEHLAANRALGAALHKLARDPDPQARAAGATIAATVTDLVNHATATAVDATTVARRHAGEVARRLPDVLAQLDQAHHRARAAVAQARPSDPARTVHTDQKGTP